MDLGLHLTHSDATSKLDPEVLAIASRITPNLSNAFGKVWDLFGLRPAPLTTDEYEVYVRSFTQPEVVSGTSGGGLLWDHVSTAAALPITAGTIDRLTIGDVLMYGSEIVVVKSVDRSGNTIDVYERGAGESSGAQHGAGGDTLKIVGNAHEEGKVDATAMAETTAKVTNYCQLIEELVDLSKEDSDQARKFGRTEDALKAEAMERVFRDLARTAIDGVAVAPTASKPGMSRGLRQYLQLSGGITTNVAGAFTETSLKTILETIRKAGGTVNALVMSIAKKKLFNAFSGADIVHEDANRQVTGRIVQAYLADGFGEIPVIVDLDWPDTEVALIDTRKLGKGWKVNDTLRFVDEPVTSSREKKQSLQGKFGLDVQGVGTSHGLLTGLT